MGLGALSNVDRVLNMGVLLKRAVANTLEFSTQGRSPFLLWNIFFSSAEILRELNYFENLDLSFLFLALIHLSSQLSKEAFTPGGPSPCKEVWLLPRG